MNVYYTHTTIKSPYQDVPGVIDQDQEIAANLQEEEAANAAAAVAEEEEEAAAAYDGESSVQRIISYPIRV